MQLRAIAQRGLALAPANFAGARGKETRSTTEERRYLVAGSLAKDCARCEVIDEYAIGSNLHERWVYEFDYYGEAGWTQGRLVEFAERAIGPLVRSYDLKTGSTDAEETYLDWKSKNTFVYVETFEGKSGAGVTIRIGHYLNKDVHVVRYSSELTAGEKARLADDLKNVLSLGLANAPTNFETMRGAKREGNAYTANVTFDDMMEGCTIAYNKPSSSSKNDANWDLICYTTGFGGDAKALEEFVRSTMWYALPNSFHSSADGDKGDADYRWEDGTAQVTVSLTQESYDDYRVQYEIDIRHWLS